PLLFRLSSHSRDDIARIYIGVVPADQNRSANRAIELFPVEMDPCLILGIMLKSCRFERRSETVAAFEGSLQKRGRELLFRVDRMMAAVLTVIAPGKDDV